MAQAEVAVQRRAETIEVDWPRIRFTASISIYGGALGALLLIVNRLAAVPVNQADIEHMPLGQALLFGGFGAMASVVVTAPAAWWLYGGVPKYAATKKRFPRSIFIWFLIGTVYAFLLPFVLGGYFYEMAIRLLGFYGGSLSVPEIMEGTIDQIILSAFKAFILGFDFFFTGLKLAGPLFIPGAWIIDRFNGSDHPATAKYGPWVLALALSAVIIVIMVVVPAPTLARFG